MKLSDLPCSAPHHPAAPAFFSKCKFSHLIAALCV
ncbi:hypothetical protein SLEP1_g2952 [Rubroshorea leprosula]|uniref:Uncharacterized protein n=1 Tax=Rubroshorea leprosula TaxID=152421 RepID=A0AAV5HSI3_9ROSI|nr:hypothetical protein SLEP1_g2952 [Rubroshorea leprosula]